MHIRIGDRVETGDGEGIVDEITYVCGARDSAWVRVLLVMEERAVTYRMHELLDRWPQPHLSKFTLKAGTPSGR